MVNAAFYSNQRFSAESSGTKREDSLRFTTGPWHKNDDFVVLQIKSWLGSRFYKNLQNTFP